MSVSENDVLDDGRPRTKFGSIHASCVAPFPVHSVFWPLFGHWNGGLLGPLSLSGGAKQRPC